MFKNVPVCLIEGENGGEGGGGGKAYTPPASQEEFDRIITDRLARDRAKFADYDQLKAAKVELDQIKAEAASELDKAKAAAKDEGRTEALTVANRRVIGAEAKAIAAELKFHRPADVLGLVDLNGVKVSDDGEPDAAEIKQRIESAVNERPYLVAGGTKQEPKRDQGQGRAGGEKPNVGDVKSAMERALGRRVKPDAAK